MDREEIALRALSTSIHSDELADVTDENAIHIGGVKSSNDPRFTDFDHFDGCISSNISWGFIFLFKPIRLCYYSLD